jgi:starch phosphorylase
MVREYVESFYRPMVARGKQRNATTAAQLVQWQDHIALHWPRLRFGKLTSQRENGKRVFDLDVYLDGLQPEQIMIEIVAEASEYGDRIVQPMALAHGLPGAEDSYLFSAEVPDRPEDHYTPRIRAHHPLLNMPLEDQHVLWYR